jgi:carbonic anhydrase
MRAYTGPSHWPVLCSAGNMQSSVDIQHAEKLPIYVPKINYKPADLDILNDCNQYRILVKFPDNDWLLMAKKPYNLLEAEPPQP